MNTSFQFCLTRVGVHEKGKTLMDLTQTQEELKGAFIGYMRGNWGNYYYKLAGMRMLELSKDREIRERGFVIQGGDWVVYDSRSKSGTYGVSHESDDIQKVTLVNPKKYEVDYSEKIIEFKVDALELMKRFQLIASLFIDYAHRENADFYIQAEEATEKYHIEKAHLSNDPHLALYWLLHFGFTLDKRYQEVREMVVSHDYPKEIQKYVEGAMIFFDNEEGFENIDLSHWSRYKVGTPQYEALQHVFLSRRAFLIYWEHVYKNYNPENLHYWWLSVKMYPRIGKNLIYRMRWLKNNVEKCNLWHEFEQLLTSEDKDIHLISYLFATNPNKPSKEREAYANKLLQELLAETAHYKSRPNFTPFVQIFIWDVREFADKALLKDATDAFFVGSSEGEDEYKDILNTLATPTE